MASDSAPQLDVVSIIIPAHNAAGTIHRALRSAVTQDYEGPIEVCVYDDASTDATIEEVVAFKKSLDADGPASRSLHLISSTDLGVSAPMGPAFARNRAAEHSKGAYICLLDADDEALPSRVRLQLYVSMAPSQLFACCGVREYSC